MTRAVTLTLDNQVAIVTFNRTEHMNALNKEMCAQLEDIICKIKKNSFIRVIILRGAGEVFMAGSDLYEIYKEMDKAMADSVCLIRQFNAITLSLREMDKIVVAAVHGLVAGQGMSLMLAADLVVASEKTRFSLGYCNVATVPAGGVSFRLPRLVGAKKAMELLIMSEMFDAEQALAMGLINWVVPNDELTDYVFRLTDKIINGPMLAYAQTKHLINSSWQNKFASQLELEAEAFIKTINSKDFKTAVRAFVNKRQPDFEGR